jgi:hypothetical protein
MGLSALCMVHCALTPLLILAWPLVGSHDFDAVTRLALAGLGLSGVGLGTWLHRNHKAVAPLCVALVSFVSLAVYEAITGHHPAFAFEFGLGLLGSFALMGAHALNTRACRESDHDCAPGRWFADSLWACRRPRLDRGFMIAVAFAGGLHAALFGIALQL